MLKKLLIINFQKHAHLEIEFKVDGVNVLTGASEIGKSCIRRAMEFVFEHQTFQGQRKVNTKKTSVKAWLKDNKTVERIISNSINRYIISQNGSEQVFDSVGKIAPLEVREFIGIYPIDLDGEEIYLNSYPQIGKPFLFDQSPSARMKLFNKLTGNDILDKLFAEFNKDILKIKRNIREETENFEKRSTDFESKKTETEKAIAIHTRLKKRMLCLKEKYKKYENLLKLKQNLESNLGNQKKVTLDIKGIQVIQDDVLQVIKKKIDRYDRLVTVDGSSEKVYNQLKRVREGLKELMPLSINLDDLRGKIERFGDIRGIYDKFSQIKRFQGEFGKKLKVVNMDIKYDHKELDKYEVCRECDGRGVKFNE